MPRFFIENESLAQASIIGYALTLSICTMVLVSTTFMVSIYVDQRNQSAASLEAQSIANRVVNVVLEAANLKQSNPNASFYKSIEIPLTIASYAYFIEATNYEVIVTSKDGSIQEKSNTFNVTEEPNILSVFGQVESGYNYLYVDLDEINSVNIEIAGSYTANI